MIKNPSENGHLTGHFQRIFLLISPEKTNSKTSKVKLKSVLNLKHILFFSMKQIHVIFRGRDNIKNNFRFFFSIFQKITVGGFVNQLIKQSD